MKRVVLFGAGASFGSGGVVPFPSAVLVTSLAISTLPRPGVVHEGRDNGEVGSRPVVKPPRKTEKKDEERRVNATRRSATLHVDPRANLQPTNSASRVLTATARMRRIEGREAMTGGLQAQGRHAA